MKLTPHVTLEDLTTSGNHPNIPNPLPPEWIERARLVAYKLEQVQAILGVPLRYSYGYRCKALNTACGGSDTSDHMQMLAADFNPVGLGRDEAFRRLWADPEFMRDVDQLILERGCLHLGMGRKHRCEGRGDRPYPLLAEWPAPLPEVIA